MNSKCPRSINLIKILLALWKNETFSFQTRENPPKELAMRRQQNENGFITRKRHPRGRTKHVHTPSKQHATISFEPTFRLIRIKIIIFEKAGNTYCKKTNCTNPWLQTAIYPILNHQVAIITFTMYIQTPHKLKLMAFDQVYLNCRMQEDILHTIFISQNLVDVLFISVW